MLWSLSFVAVRQQENERGMQAPLGPRGDDELVYHHLAGIGEIPELRLPEHQRARRMDAVAVLEGEDGGLRKRTVVDGEGGARLRQRLQRRIAGSGGEIVEYEVALAEGATLGVLAGHTNRCAIGQDGREG